MNLLGRARKMWQGLGPAEPQKPQYYDVACAEGHRLQGQRNESYQALRCPTCDRGIFVLPLSRLPDPPAPRTKRESAAGFVEPIDEGPILLENAPTQRLVGDDEPAAVDWLEPESDPDESERPESPKDDGFEAIIPEALAAPEPVRSKPGPAPRADGRVASGEQEPEQANTISVSRRPRRRRPLFIMTGVVLLIAVTAGYRAWRVQLQNLPQQAEADLLAGKAALETGDFTNAKYRLGDAASALERLGANEAASVRQAASEAAILADLINISLEELVQEAVRARSPDDWQAQFDRLYKNQAILIEDELAAATEGNGGVPELHYRVLAGAKPAVGRVDLTGLKLFAGSAFKPGTRVTFGARLASVQLEASGRWRITLVPESGVLITDFKPLSFLGWNPSEPAANDGAGP